ncbi:MAG: signal peptidase II [Alphaproteobacteria bacterium]|jgi:signal peptidase II
MKISSPFTAGALAVVLTILLDQLSKWWILTIVMNPPKRIPLIEFFSLVLVYNRGVSFGIFNDAPDWARWALIVFAVLIAAALLIWMRYAESRLLALALGFVAGGAIGNVIDRIYYGAVVDFLDFHVGAWHWPAFNVADSAITVGVALLIVDSLKSDSKTP